MNEGIEALSPVELEILSHRLWCSLVEARNVVKRASGTLTVVYGEALTAIYTAEGDCSLVATGVLSHSMGAPYLIKEILKAYEGELYDGDAFFSNDPWLGTLHTADQYVILPIFYKNELIAWAVALTHCPEVGAIEPGSMPPSAREIFHEGLVIPYMKIRERWKEKKEILRLVEKMVRDPRTWILDMKAKLAGCEALRKRLIEMIEKYGVNKIKTLLAELINMAERIARSKLSKLPDVELQAVGYIDYDGVKPVKRKIVCRFIKKGDRLVIDFTGTDEANPSSMNCTYYGTLGSTFVAVAPLLFPEAPWNSGLLRAVEVIAPEGTMVNCIWPSACSQAPPTPGKLITSLVTTLIGKAYIGSEKYRTLACASWSAESGSIHIGGLDHYGKRFAALIWESGHLAGTGACSDMDGSDDGGSQMHIAPHVPDVEAYESRYPILYLYRKHRLDSHGYGKYRGGSGVECAIMVYGAKADLDVSISGAYGGREILSFPLCGGLPAETIKGCYVLSPEYSQKFLKEGKIPSTLEDFLKFEKIKPVGGFHPSIKLSNGCIIAFYTAQGGAGYGDPLTRNPELVLSDVKNKITSLDVAKNVYGVVIDEKFNVNFKATEELRSELRRRRLQAATPPKEVPKVKEKGEKLTRIHEYLAVDENGNLRCLICDYIICNLHVEPNYMPYLASRKVSSQEIRRSYFHDGKVLLENDIMSIKAYYCPNCGTQIEIEIE